MDLDEQQSFAPPPSPPCNAPPEWFLRGSPYSHTGYCTGETCASCYKYSCSKCGERSNLLFSCLFCSAHKTDLKEQPIYIAQVFFYFLLPVRNRYTRIREAPIIHDGLRDVHLLEQVWSHLRRSFSSRSLLLHVARRRIQSMVGPEDEAPMLGSAARRHLRS